MRYLEGVSLAAIGRGNRRMLAPLKARHADAAAEHADTLEAWKKRRKAAREIKDPEERAKALDALRRQRPIHPVLVATGAAVVGAVLLLGIPSVRHHVGVILTAGLTVWLLTALVAGQQAEEGQGQASIEEEQDAGPEGEFKESAEPASPTPAVVHSRVATLTAGGRSLLLTVLAAHLAADHPGWQPSTKAVRGLLAEACIPVRPGVRTVAGNGPGIHHEDVPPIVAAPESVVVANVGAGQDANANANNAEEWATREGFVFQADPDNPARTAVISRTNAA